MRRHGGVTRLGRAVALGLGLLWCADAAATGPLAVAGAVLVEVEQTATRFTLELDREVDFSVFALADPYRVVIELPEVDFRLPSDAATHAKGLISDFRFGLFSPGRSRVVIDASGPVAIVDPVIFSASGDKPARLVVDLKATTRDEFLVEYALNGVPALTASAAPTMRAGIMPGGRENARKVIVIDPGHGGVDPGAVGKVGVREKDIVLQFASELAEKLRASGDFRVVLTRERDVFLRLDQRREIARQNNADLFVSIHADSIRQTAIRGATIYTVSEKASDEEAAALAAKENRADLIAGIEFEEVSDEVGDILIDLARRDTKNRSVDFAKVLVKAMRSEIKLNANPMRSAGFVVLKSPQVPSVLIELGYLSNAQDESALKSVEWRDGVTGSIVSAIERHFSAELAAQR